MANVTITQLPPAGAITGTEAVPIVQNGVTVQTTTAAISASPSQNQTFLTLNQESTLPNSRRLSGGTGVGLTDAGALSTLQIALNGASGSLEVVGNGLIAKTASNAVTARQIAVAGTGLAVTNANGVSGNPTLALDGLIAAIAAVSGTGILAFQNGTTAGGVQILGTANQIGLANGNGLGGNPTVSIADNVVLPGTGAATVPIGTAAQQPAGANGQIRFNTTTSRFQAYQNGGWFNIGVGDGSVTSVFGTVNQITVVNGSVAPIVSIALNPVLPGTASVTLPQGATILRPGSPTNGMFRYNTDTGLLEAYLNGVWVNLASGSGVTSVATGAGLLGGPITSTGTIDIDPTIVATLTGTQTLTGKTISGASNTVSVSNALTASTGLSGGTYDGSVAVNFTIDSTVATLTGTQTLTNKTIDANSNTLSNIANSSLTNSSVTLGSTNVALGGTTATLGGLTSVEVTQDPVTALQLATKQYVDAVAQGLNVHAACDVATTGTLASITGGTVTYNNGTAGVGATLTLSVALTVLNGYSLVNGDRILVKDEVATANNGIYTWATGGTVLTRATDFDTNIEIAAGDFTFVTYGTSYAATGWVQTLPVATVGTSPIVWAQFSGAGSYTAGNGLTLTGGQFSLTAPVSIANGGTGQVTAAAAFNALSPVTSTGDLILGDGANSSTRLGIGTSGFVLKSTGTTAAWQLNPTYLPVVLHSGSPTNISVASGYLPVLLSDGVTTVNVALY